MKVCCNSLFSSGQVTTEQSAIAEMSEKDLSDESEESDLTQHHQHLLDEESTFLQHYSSSLAQASENPTPYEHENFQWEQQHVMPEVTQEITQESKSSPRLLHTSLNVFTANECIQNSNDVSLLNYSTLPAVPEAVCLMVEDPYFDTPLSSPSPEEAPINEEEEDSKWTCSPIFSAPSLLLNDQDMEPSFPASGKQKHLCRS